MTHSTPDLLSVYSDTGTIEIDPVYTHNSAGEVVAVTEFYPDQSISLTAELHQGVYHGEFISFHSNGEIEQHGYYIKGKKNGRFITNYPSGQIWMEQHFLNDKLHGEVSYYDAQGRRTLRMHLRHDVLHGVYETFDSEGRVASSVTYHVGAMESVPNGYDQKTGLARLSFFRRYAAPWART